MKLEEGMYVRTKDGVIDKLIIDYKGTCNNPNCNCKHISCIHNYYDEDNILKSRKEIIELLEVGDYVNGLPVVHNAKNNGGNIVIVVNGDAYNEEEIKSILTKEQYENNCYKVEDI